MTTYIFNRLNNQSASDINLFLQSLPNFISCTVPEETTEVLCNFNHTTTQQKNDFIYELSENGIEIETLRGNNHLLPNKKLRYINDSPVVTDTYNTTLTNLSTSYVNCFSSAVNNLRIPIDTRGFERLAYQIFWNKNGGTSQHDFKIVNFNDETKTLVEITNIQTGETSNFNTTINTIAAGHFTRFTGFLKLMAKSGNGIDDPVLIMVRLYLRR